MKFHKYSYNVYKYIVFNPIAVGYVIGLSTCKQLGKDSEKWRTGIKK
jgi:hypothetical protein